MEGLPIHIFDSTALYSIANLIGKPLKADNATIQLTRPSVARVCVELDLSKELPNSVWIHLGKLSFLQPIHYEDLPAFCTSCRKYGHKNCKKSHSSSRWIQREVRTDVKASSKENAVNATEIQPHLATAQLVLEPEDAEVNAHLGLEPAVVHVMGTQSTTQTDIIEATDEGANTNFATEIPNETDFIDEVEGTQSTTPYGVEGAKTIDGARAVVNEGTHSAAPIELEGAKAIHEAKAVATEAVTKGIDDADNLSKNTLPNGTSYEKLSQQSLAQINQISNDVSTINNATTELNAENLISSNKATNADTKEPTESVVEETPEPHLANKDLPPTDLDPPIEEFPPDEFLYPEIENDPSYKEVLENMRRNNPGRYGNMTLNQIDDFIEKRSSPQQLNSAGTSNPHFDDFQEVHHKRAKNTSKRPTNPRTVATRNYDPTLEVGIVSLVPKYWPSRKTTTMERIITTESYTGQFWYVGPVGPIGKDGKRPKKVMPKNKTFDDHPGFIIWE
ncbi:unnamed protein product [Cuscuta campestris]|uniref:Uncharacterized protein n=1 Tax=Cuscuta campestris TaxID=132261 RepID=A0A484MLL9_9ASTE|nr:unnamed protein product [Cuscuta campestris]